ncbi:hypothetical protein CHS0354_037194 [Potamilus streckersoni]|uniref:Uncharacterized protein n=1 Tax=Potamilus streckersoni TaxID=2493646 RepID=A0AAE0SX57_9BIVA|nr:hypothetical protein CHS0354_037194 [Potamilus streckersoni]
MTAEIFKQELAVITQQLHPSNQEEMGFFSHVESSTATQTNTHEICHKLCGLQPSGFSDEFLAFLIINSKDVVKLSTTRFAANQVMVLSTAEKLPFLLLAFISIPAICSCVFLTIHLPGLGAGADDSFVTPTPLTVTVTVNAWIHMMKPIAVRIEVHVIPCSMDVAPLDEGGFVEGFLTLVSIGRVEENIVCSFIR